MPEAEEALTRTSYNVVADVYADHFRTTEGEQPIDLATIDHFVALLHEPRVVLDAGCGAGRMLPYLAGRGCHAEGIDLSPNMVRRARADHPDFTVAEEFLYARKWDSEAERAAALKTWNRHYNYHRPHGAHDGQPPASATPARVNNVMASYT